MGVELRSIQRKFHTLMDELKPQIRPRFVVWLDERLAEFKVRGRMELAETLDDPQWIKDYYTSKRDAKAAAIKERKSRDAGSSTGSVVHPKVEAKSESSNGVAHPEELEEGKEETQSEYKAASPAREEETTPQAETGQSDQGFQLVEVKREQIEEDDDDDMIIVGETIAPQRPPVSYPSQYNPVRQMYGGFARNVGSFHRKRQRFGSIPQRPSMAMSSGTRFKSRMKQNFRSAPLSSTANTSFPSHSATSQSLYTSSPSSQSYHTEAPSYTGDAQDMYEGGDTHVYASETSQYSGESLRIPPHLQAQAAGELQTGEEDYEVTEGDMYADYGDESYDSSYLADTTDSSLIQYDEQGNAVIKGENLAGDPSMEPMPGTSSEATSQDKTAQEMLENILESMDEESRLMFAPSRNMLDDGIELLEVNVTPGDNSDTGGGQELERSNETTPRNVKKNVYICEYCSKQYRSRSGLYDHIQSEHRRVFRYACSICNKKFQNKSHFLGHVNSHAQLKPFKCTRCGCLFVHADNLSRHKRTCGVCELFQCEICGVMFRSKSTYEEHRQGKHLDRVFVCECGETFNWRSSLKYHKKRCSV